MTPENKGSTLCFCTEQRNKSENKGSTLCFCAGHLTVLNLGTSLYFCFAVFRGVVPWNQKTKVVPFVLKHCCPIPLPQAIATLSWSSYRWFLLIFKQFCTVNVIVSYRKIAPQPT